MKKVLKTVLIAVLLLVILGALITAVLLVNYNNSYIGTKAATEIALADSGLERREIIDLDTEFEKTPYSAWYEVDFETHGMEYNYSIDAVTGEILHSSAKPDR